MKFQRLNRNEIYPIPVGDYFGKRKETCYLVYAPLKNQFFLATPVQVAKLEELLAANTTNEILRQMIAIDS